MEPLQTRTAACQCGGVSIRLKGEPTLVSSCCCEACQRRTGAFVAVTVFFDENQVVERRGGTKVFRRVAESGNGIDFNFCPECGSTVWWRGDGRPGKVMVAGGAFADPGLPTPERIIWTQHRHPSVPMPEGLPQYPRGPA